MKGVECCLSTLTSGLRPWGEAAGSVALPHIIRRIDLGKAGKQQLVLLFSVDIKTSNDRWGIGCMGGRGDVERGGSSKRRLDGGTGDK